MLQAAPVEARALYLHTGDARDFLIGEPDSVYDSVVTDPPAGISFMGKEWDADKGGRAEWVAWLTEIMREVYRVLKPGSHGLVWALPKRSGWTAWALESAGFEIRDCVTHINGQGFAKGANVSKHIDKAAGAEREVIGVQVLTGTARTLKGDNYNRGMDVDKLHTEHLLTAPATPEAHQWDGWGTALKPSQEMWYLVRKPLGEKTIAANVLKHGTGALNIDATRVAYRVAYKEGETSSAAARRETAKRTGNAPMQGRILGSEKASAANARGTIGRRGDPAVYMQERPSEKLGRWPANIVFSHVDGDSCPDCEEGDTSGCATCHGTGEVGGCRCVGTKKVQSGTAYEPAPSQRGMVRSVYGATNNLGRTLGYADTDGKETVEDWECVEGCPVRALDSQTGVRRSGSGAVKRTSGAKRGENTGSVSRFFYCAKAASKERYFLCRTCDKVYPKSKLKAHKGHDIFLHPTQKSQELMEYLVRMITPPGGIVLDPFMGSGSTVVAALAQGFSCVGVDADADAVRVARHRTSALDDV